MRQQREVVLGLDDLRRAPLRREPERQRAVRREPHARLLQLLVVRKTWARAAPNVQTSLHDRLVLADDGHALVYRGHDFSMLAALLGPDEEGDAVNLLTLDDARAERAPRELADEFFDG